VCFYIPKKEQTKKDNLQSERAISSRWFGYRFLLWKQVPDHSSSTRSRKPEFTPLQVNLLQEYIFGNLSLNFTFFQLHQHALLPSWCPVDWYWFFNGQLVLTFCLTFDGVLHVL